MKEHHSIKFFHNICHTVIRAKEIVGMAYPELLS